MVIWGVSVGNLNRCMLEYTHMAVFLREGKQIFASPGQPLATEEDITRYIEEPLQPAVRELVHKGIDPHWSTANGETNEHWAAIAIDRENLSSENIRIAIEEGYLGEGDARVVLEMIATGETRVSKIEEVLLEKAIKFTDQKKRFFQDVVSENL